MNKLNRPGLTLVETIVAALFVTLIGGLIVPCLKKMDEAEDLETCRNRLREIAIAAHNFHDAHRRLPPATIGYSEAVNGRQWGETEEYDHYWKGVQNTSSLGLLMPFMDGLLEDFEDINPIAFDMYKPLKDHHRPDSTDPIYDWQGEITGVQDVSIKQFNEFLCPADNLNEDDCLPIVATQPCKPYGEDNEDIATMRWPESLEMVMPQYTNYIASGSAVGGAAYDDDDEAKKWRGAMSSVERVTLETIADGTSRTIMYGESVGAIEDGERTTVQSWFWGGMARARGGIPAMQHNDPHNDERTMLGDAKYSSAVGFSSKHETGVVLTFCDASVHVISRRINWMTLYELAGAGDGGTPIR